MNLLWIIITRVPVTARFVSCYVDTQTSKSDPLSPSVSPERYPFFLILFLYLLLLLWFYYLQDQSL